MTYLDTHAAAWLRAGDPSAFDKTGRRILETDDELLISPIVLLELQMLFEKKRLSRPPHAILSDLTAYGGVRVCDFPFLPVIESANRETWTRDPFDRIITAHARLRAARLLTQDALIRENYELAVW